MIKYIGSKRLLLPVISDAVGAIPEAETVIDLFSGTSRVGHALKKAGFRVISNDHNTYAATLARCYVQADREDVLRRAELLVEEFNSLGGDAGYFTETFCVKARYLHPRNGERIDAIREAIAAKALEPELEAVMLVSLMEAADRVDSTTGLQMAYLKRWAPRAHNELRLRVPDVLPRLSAGRRCAAHQLDALEAARKLEGDVAYIDPPYNQHSYLGNYHVWESLVRWDKPSVYGVACKRIDCKERRSVFNSKRSFKEAIWNVLRSVRARNLVVSFNNEGFTTHEEMMKMLGLLHGGEAEVSVVERSYKRYVGARIGIHNPEGERVGKVSHLDNKEYVFIVSPPGEAHARSDSPGKLASK